MGTNTGSEKPPLCLIVLQEIPTRSGLQQGCADGFTQMPDGACCANNLVSKDANGINRCREGVQRIPIQVVHLSEGRSQPLTGIAVRLICSLQAENAAPMERS